MPAIASAVSAAARGAGRLQRRPAHASGGAASEVNIISPTCAERHCGPWGDRPRSAFGASSSQRRLAPDDASPVWLSRRSSKAGLLARAGGGGRRGWGRGGSCAASLSHWLERYEDKDLVDQMNWVMGHEGEARAREDALRVLLPEADVPRLVSKYPVLLGMDKRSVARRLVALTTLIPHGDICRMVELQPMMLLIPDAEAIAREAVQEIVAHLEVGEEVVWAMVARHPNLIFQDPPDRRRASTEYLLLDQHTPVGKGFRPRERA